MHQAGLCSCLTSRPSELHFDCVSTMFTRKWSHRLHESHTYWDIYITSYNNFPMVTLSMYTNKPCDIIQC